jgi:hypothetical protein
MHRFSYEDHAALQIATLPARLVGLAAERLDMGDATAPEDVEADLEARVAALRDLQSVVLLAVAAD